MFNNRYQKTRLLTVVLLYACLFPCSAQTLDPTRPPVLHAAPKAPAPAVEKPPQIQPPQIQPELFQVTSILLAPHRQVAVINAQVVTVGEQVHGDGSVKAKVTAITTSEVTLKQARREFVVRLPSSSAGKVQMNASVQHSGDTP